MHSIESAWQEFKKIHGEEHYEVCEDYAKTAFVHAYIDCIVQVQKLSDDSKEYIQKQVQAWLDEIATLQRG